MSLESAKVTEEETSTGESLVLDRLARRGIEYVEIKKIVSLNLPHATLFLERHGSHSAPQVLRQVERWKRVLKSDFIFSAEQKAEIKTTLAGLEMFAWNALIEASFPKLGPWQMSREFLPNRKDPEPRYIDPDIRIIAVHEATGETRSAAIPGGRGSVAIWGDVWRAAFADLGLLELVLKQSRRRLVSARRSQAWPIFTMGVIPRLYDFLSPFYRQPGHVWSEKESVLKRDALFPNDLLDDMRDILRLEHPADFHNLTRDQLKAVVQRYIGRTSPKY